MVYGGNEHGSVATAVTGSEVRLFGAFRIGLPGLLTLAIVYGYGRYGYGLFLPVLQREFGGSAGVLGAISSVGYVAELAVLVVVGRLSGRRGPLVPIVVGGVSAAVGMMLMAVAPNTGTLAIGVALAGTAPGWVWAPYSDAVAIATRPGARGHALSMVSTGTTFGVLLAGPAVLLFSGSGWRTIWFGAACAALLVTVWNLFALPKPPPAGSIDPDAGRPRWQVLLRTARYRRLLAAAFSAGLVGAVYWSYAGVLVAAGGYSDAVAAPLLWSLIGAAGVVGTATGALVNRCGMPRVFGAAQLCTLVSCGLLALGSSSLAVLVVAAVLYGAGFMVAGTLVALWSSRLFPDCPTAGFSVVVIALTIGAAAGPAVFGLLVDTSGVEVAFAVLSAVVAATLLVRPRSGEVGSPSPE